MLCRGACVLTVRRAGLALQLRAGLALQLRAFYANTAHARKLQKTGGKNKAQLRGSVANIAHNRPPQNLKSRIQVSKARAGRKYRPRPAAPKSQIKESSRNSACPAQIPPIVDRYRISNQEVKSQKHVSGANTAHRMKNHHSKTPLHGRYLSKTAAAATQNSSMCFDHYPPWAVFVRQTSF